MANIFGNSNSASTTGNTAPQRKALIPDDFDGDTLVGTVEGKPIEFESNQRRRWAIHFREYPEYVYYAGYMQMKGLTALLGNDDDKFNGQRVVLEIRAVDNPSKPGTKVDKWYPMEPAAQRKFLQELDAASEEVVDETTPEPTKRRRDRRPKA